MTNIFVLGKKGVSLLTVLSMVATLSMPLLYPSAVEAATVPVWYTSDQQEDDGDSDTATVLKPSNLESGDLVIVLLHLKNRPGNPSFNVDAPDGFNLIRAEGNISGSSRPWLASYYKIAGSSEPANYSFALPSDMDWYAVSGRVTDYNSSDPIGGDSGINSDETNVTNQIIPSFTNLENDSLLIAALTVRDNESGVSGPSGMTNIYSVSSSSRDLLVRASTQEIDSGSTGSKTFSWTGNERAVAQMFSINPNTNGNLIVHKTTVPSGDETEFSITASGTGTITGGGSGAITDATDKNYEVTAGTYSVSETSQTGWTETSNTCTNIEVSAGETEECTITNTKLGEIHGMKFEDTNGNGEKDEGEMGLSGWTINLTGEDHSTVSTQTDENGMYSFFDVFADIYTVTETQQTGWMQTTENPEPITIVNGEGASNVADVNFGNFEKVTITVKKDVVNPEGDEAEDNSVFKVKLDEGAEFNFSEDSSKEYINVGPGSHTVMEVVPGDPDFDLLSISDDNNDNALDGTTFNTHSGQDVTITITNKQKQGTLTVNKVVTHPNGGTETAGAFSFNINDGEENYFFVENEENNLLGTIEVPVNPGTYTVIENSLEGVYAIGYSANCTNVEIPSNGSAECTITNSDIPENMGSITVIKDLPNDNGGEFSLSDFPLKVTSVPEEAEEPVVTEMTSGQYTFFAPGSYVISESNPNELEGFTTSVSCTDDGENTITDDDGDINILLANQQSWVCTITNDDQSGTLIIEKVVTNNNGGTATADDFSFQVEEDNAIAFEADGHNEITVDAGVYSITEVAVEGYTTSYENCSEVEVVNGGTATCIITNDDQPGTIIVKKIVINDDQGVSTAGSFAFQVNGEGSTSFIQDGENSLMGENSVEVNAGTYSITEVAVEGYTTSYENCSEVVVGNGETVTCTITNNDIGDMDNDGTEDDEDNCPAVANEGQLDTDNDGMGDACDPDDDNDGQTDANETSCGSNPLSAESESTDTDNDNIPDCVDTDDDNDTIADGAEDPDGEGGISAGPDNCPLIANTNQTDTDNDGQGDVCDSNPNGSAGKITVIKVVINDNGGTKVVADFPLFVGLTPVLSGVQSAFTAGTYTVSETQKTGYVSVFSGDCDATGLITLGVGETKACTITNDDVGVATGGGQSGGSIPTFKLGDINKDGHVDSLDLAIMMTEWGKTGTNVADLNVDGKVDEFDLSILMANWE